MSADSPLPVPTVGDFDYSIDTVHQRHESLALWREFRETPGTNSTKDIPVFQSQPYFLGAPDYAANNTKFGILEPDPQRDQTTLYVEPITGVAVYIRAAAQFNVELHKMGFVLGLEDLASMLVPIVYEIDTQVINKKSVDSLELLVGPAQESKIALVAVGYTSFAGLLLLHVWLLFKHRCPPQGVRQCCRGDCDAVPTQGFTDPFIRAGEEECSASAVATSLRVAEESRTTNFLRAGHTGGGKGGLV